MKRPPVAAMLVVALIVAAVAVLYWRDARSPAHLLVKEAEAYDGQNPLIQKMKRGEATLGELVEGVGSVDKTRRRQSARAIFALRQHFITDVQAIVERGYKDPPAATKYAGDHSPDGQMQLMALLSLAALRPSDKRVIQDAVEHIGFDWTPMAGGLNDTMGGNGATYVLVDASTAALPSLTALIATTPLPRDKDYVSGDTMVHLCALSILGPGTPKWLKRQAIGASGPAHKAALAKAAAYMASRTDIAPGFDVPELVIGFLASRRLTDSGMDPRDLEAIDINTYKVPWSAPEDLADQSILENGRYSPEYHKKVIQIEVTMGLLAYAVAQRLDVASDKSSHRYKKLYPAQGRVDAVRVLGCLRPIGVLCGSWSLWHRLRQLSLQSPIENQPSEETAAIYRALGQIDIPAVHALVERICEEENGRTRRAATFALGKIMGRYGVDFIKQEIARHGRWIKDKTDPDRPQYIAEVKRMRAMIKLGTEKKWFVGEYYGYNDPHAYDLIFPDETPKPVATTN